MTGVVRIKVPPELKRPQGQFRLAKASFHEMNGQMSENPYNCIFHFERGEVSASCANDGESLDFSPVELKSLDMGADGRVVVRTISNGPLISAHVDAELELMQIIVVDSKILGLKLTFVSGAICVFNWGDELVVSSLFHSEIMSDPTTQFIPVLLGDAGVSMD